MLTDLQKGAVITKTRELCQTILDQPDFAELRQNIDAFMNDEAAKTQYRELTEKGSVLQHKQQSGMTVDMKEINAFEQQREQFLNNPVAQGFLDAQQIVHNVQESVTQHLTKTFELGRLPNPEDFEGSCGHGCGCHH